MKNKINFICIACFLILLGIGCNKQSQLVQKNIAVAKKYIEAWNSNDSLKLASLYAKDFRHRDMSFQIECKTMDKLNNFVGATFRRISNMKIIPTSIIASDSMAVVEWIWTGTFTGGWGIKNPEVDKPFTIQGVSVIVIENGQIRRNYEYYDKDPLRKKEIPK